MAETGEQQGEMIATVPERIVFIPKQGVFW
jgi:hypothetical protein